MAQVDYQVRRSDRARTVRVHVDPVTAAVEVVLPRRAPAKAAGQAVAQLTGWIDRRVQEARAAQAVVRARGTTVPYLDGVLTLSPQAGRTRVHRRGNLLLVPDQEALPALERWYRRQARAELEPRITAAAEAVGVSYSGLRIAAQRTRWGSCSRTGVLSFNWRLLLAPAAVLDYVVWHEVCHLRVLDHSPAFWALVAAHVPDYEVPSTWLRRNGATLVLAAP